ncbi:MAG: DUF2971 domain-containing protein [Terriglobia bacterium]|nr:DUF2971 domain-containing protein [Terriglobia bacterium]
MSEQVSDPVLGLITSPVPEILWHYTDNDGFRGILNCGHIYATNLRFLNDKEEFEHAFTLAKQLLLEALPPESEDPDPPLVRQLVVGTFERIFSEGPLCQANLSLFTMSFTLHGDQLSQWRGYSRGSAGVSLGFDLRAARSFTAPETAVTFAPCIYRDDDKVSLLRHLVGLYLRPVLRLAMDTANMPTVLRALDELAEARPDLGREEVKRLYGDQLETRRKKELPQVVSEITAKLLHVMALIKHSAFEEEQEWRFIYPVLTGMENPPTVKFRSRSNTLVPYIEIPVMGGDKPPLREIILGPGSDGTLAVASARAFLDSVGLKDVRVSQSRVPYRPW